MAMDLSVDGENLELTQQVQQCHVVIASLRSTFAQIIQLKRGDPSLSPPTVAELAKLRTRSHMLFLELKQLNRTVAFLGQNMRLRVQGKKVSQTQVNLDFQGLLYQKSHFVKEIHKCQDFKPAADDISLIPEEEFYSLAKIPPITDPHTLLVARLEHEVKLRQRLLVDLDKLKALQAQHELTLAKHKENSQDIRKLLMGVIGNASKLEAQLPGKALDVPTSPAANRLPKPLFTLYHTLRCHQQYYRQGLQVQIAEEGTGEEAVTLHVNPQKEGESLVVTSHECRVVLALENGGELMFRYLLPLGVVSVSVSGPGTWGSMLTNLFPLDDGVAIPTNVALLGVPVQLDTKKLGTCYRWLQELCGLHFNHPLQTVTYLRSLNIASFLQTLQRRTVLRTALQRQYDALAAQPPVVLSSALEDFPQAPSSRLTTWAPTTAEEFAQRTAAANNNNNNNNDALDVDSSSNNNSNSANNNNDPVTKEWFQTGAEYYGFTVVSAAGQRQLEGVVEIPADYPDHPPSFRLAAHTEAAEIEAEVNRYFPKTLRQIAQGEEKGEFSLLSYQLKKILACCDVKSHSPQIGLDTLRSDQTPFFFKQGYESQNK